MGERMYIDHIFLTSALVAVEWSASRLGCFTPGKEPPYPLHRLGGPQRRLVHWKPTDVSEQRVASIFGVERAKQTSVKQVASCLFFDLEIGSYMFLRNVGWLSTDCTALYPRRQNSSQPSLWEPQILYYLLLNSVMDSLINLFVLGSLTTLSVAHTI
jgi:hypothetical protein